MMVSWLRSLLGLGSSLPLVETPPYVLGKAQPCPILLISGTNTNYCLCVTFSLRCSASLRYRPVLWREVERKFVSYCQRQDCGFRVRRACSLHASARWAAIFDTYLHYAEVRKFPILAWLSSAMLWLAGLRAQGWADLLAPSAQSLGGTPSLCSFVFLKHSTYFKMSLERLMHNSHTNVHKLQGSPDSSTLAASPSFPQTWGFVLI